MTPDTFTTQPLHPQDQFEAWREWYRPVFDVVPKNGLYDEFPAEVHLWKLGGLAMSRPSMSCGPRGTSGAIRLTIGSSAIVRGARILR